MASSGALSYRWIFDTGGSGRGAWSGGFGYRLAKDLGAAGISPAVLTGSSIGAFTSMDLATGDPEVLYRSWSNWSDTIPVDVPIGPDERGFFGLFSFRRSVKQSIAFTLDPPTEAALFDPRNSRRLFIVTSRVVPETAPRRGDLMRMFLMVATREWRHKYRPRGLRFEPVVYGRWPEDPEPAAAAAGCPWLRRLTPANVREALMAACLLPLVMGQPVSLDGDRLIDGGITSKTPLAFAHYPGGFALDRLVRTDRTLVVMNNPEGIMWKTALRLDAWNDSEPVRRATAAGNLLVAHPVHRIRNSTVTRDPAATMRTFDQGQEEARLFLRRDPARRFFEL
ncbi:MAG TPA: patatin-like phospholipase family protein [Acidobacteriota bacterium]|nr:patatin-like phospholipase family protein [Acidobacteriota bacterium]HQM61788.1 patatin-like phospholipase family protein [Acidobacteriota bacterium]